jgi:anthranilate synthase/aminodeoxychorismate synthase-like glutamine amidotransferase
MKQTFLKNILLIDNNDSYTYNLLQLLKQNNCKTEIINHIECSHINIQKYDGAIISPGPGKSSDYKEIFKFLKQNYKNIPILGVCLGHQIIGEFFGAEIFQLQSVYHGIKNKLMILNKSNLFDNMNEIYVGHYHSWAVSKNNFPHSELTITSLDENGLIMSFEHNLFPIFGVQFHPESYMTTKGNQIINNWLSLCK